MSEHYPYFHCRGRRDGFCKLPYLTADEVSQQVVDWYNNQPPIPEESASLLAARLDEEAEAMRAENSETIKRETTALARLKDQRKKLLHVYYEGTVTDDLFKEEQGSHAIQRSP